MTEYIYTITNKVNGKFYIGRTKNPSNRRRGHFSELRRNVHGNPKLQHAFNKYGEDSFEFEVVDEGCSDTICDLEEEWFKRYGEDQKLLYNCHFNSAGGPICNYPMSDEIKLKVSEAIKDNTRKYIFDILTERYETRASLKFLATKYGVGMNTVVDYIPEWEALTGNKMFINPQIEDAVDRVSKFLEDYDKGLVNMSHAEDYNTTVHTIRKYCHLFDKKSDELKGSPFKENGKSRALRAIEYMQETGCTALYAIEKFNSSVTTFYKYLKQS